MDAQDVHGEQDLVGVDQRHDGGERDAGGRPPGGPSRDRMGREPRDGDHGDEGAGHDRDIDHGPTMSGLVAPADLLDPRLRPPEGDRVPGALGVPDAELVLGARLVDERQVKTPRVEAAGPLASTLTW
ncbi:hypothetical protein GEV43_05475 [Actinomadura sp. J1-007]|nr:hypothetical protein [Actinomadura sp. J1-007]